MITHFEVHALLQEKIPGLAAKAYPLDVSLEIYASINRFTKYTRDALEKHEFAKAKKCFAVAETLYIKGDVIVRFLIENTFINHFSSHTSGSRSENVIMKSIIPQTLYSVYCKQLVQNVN